MHFYAWEKGLKTGMYYLRTRPKADAIQVRLWPAWTPPDRPVPARQPPRQPPRQPLRPHLVPRSSPWTKRH